MCTPLRKSDWPDNEWDTYDKVIQRFEQLIQPQNINQINKYVPVLQEDYSFIHRFPARAKEKVQASLR